MDSHADLTAGTDGMYHRLNRAQGDHAHHDFTTVDADAQSTGQPPSQSGTCQARTDRLVAAAIPSLAAAGLYVIHPLLGLALGPFFLLSWSVPRWLRTRAGAQGHEIRFEKGATGALIGLGLIVVVCVSALLVSRGELSARGYLAAVVLTAAAFLRASCTDKIMDERMLRSREAAPAREVLSP